VPIGLVERGTAQAFGLAPAEPEANRRIFAGRAAQRRLGAGESDQQHRRCPAAPSTPPGARRRRGSSPQRRRPPPARSALVRRIGLWVQAPLGAAASAGAEPARKGSSALQARKPPDKGARQPQATTGRHRRAIERPLLLIRRFRTKARSPSAATAEDFGDRLNCLYTEFHV
jgi:hypothetical protein